VQSDPLDFSDQAANSRNNLDKLADGASIPRGFAAKNLGEVWGLGGARRPVECSVASDYRKAIRRGDRNDRNNWATGWQYDLAERKRLFQRTTLSTTISYGKVPICLDTRKKRIMNNVEGWGNPHRTPEVEPLNTVSRLDAVKGGSDAQPQSLPNHWSFRLSCRIW
jgi:hypothetical protein